MQEQPVDRVDGKPRVLGIVTAMNASRLGGKIYVHRSFGRVVDHLARAYDKTYLSVPVRTTGADASRDHCLQVNNLEMIAQPFYTDSLGSLKHVVGIVRAYIRICRRVESLFVRGMVPYVGILYLVAFLYRLKPCHWITGNPIALLRTHRRAGRTVDALSTIYAWQDRVLTKFGRWLTGGAFVCNGQELGDVYRSPRTVVTVSSTVTDDEFYERSDTCQNSTVRILFIGFVRPEKGVEYLIEAVDKLKTDRPWELLLVGPCESFRGYRARLDKMIEQSGIGDRVTWEGYVSYGPDMFRYLRECDVFVLPTLSEGTPRVLVEARANSLPIVATNVGGIPTSVTDGVDGLLVPPKDAVALAQALDRIIADGELRRSLLRNGMRSARGLTVHRFVSLVAGVLEESKKV